MHIYTKSSHPMCMHTFEWVDSCGHVVRLGAAGTVRLVCYQCLVASARDTGGRWSACCISGPPWQVVHTNSLW